MEEIGEGGWLGHWRGSNRVQVGDNGRGVGVDGGSDDQSGESGAGVELEEGDLEVLALEKVEGLDLDIDTELSTVREKCQNTLVSPLVDKKRCLHSELGNSSPDGVGEGVESWLL